jgi:hypothetical protein
MQRERFARKHQGEPLTDRVQMGIPRKRCREDHAGSKQWHGHEHGTTERPPSNLLAVADFRGCSTWEFIRMTSILCLFDVMEKY